MTVREAIERADAVKPNAFSERVKLEWLRELEGKIAADVFLLAPAELRELRYTYPDDLDTELLVEAPHDDLYELYLAAKIDAQNGEYNRYANSLQLYNEHYARFVQWFGQLYDPAQGYRF